MPSIELQGVSNYACRDVDLKVEDGELMVLVGPTGAGKTTLLNIITGLVDYEGSVLFDGLAVDVKQTRLRGVGYLCQDLALFPHLDVSANIAYGLRAQKIPAPASEKRVQEILDLVRIEHLAHRYPRGLSGGEKQRVALARALAPAPRVLLLDEPLSNLDFSTAKHLRLELHRLQRELRVTTVYVTHNQREAEELGDRIAVIHEGRVEQVGTPEEIFFSPRNRQISDFIGSPNILPCDCCTQLGKGLTEVYSRGLSVVVPAHETKIEKIAISPRNIYVSTERPPGPDLNRFKGKVVQVTSSPSLTWIELQVGRHIFLAEQPTEVAAEQNFEVGDEVYLIFKLRWIKVLSGKKP